MGVRREESPRGRQSLSAKWHRGSVSGYRPLKPRKKRNELYSVKKKKRMDTID